MNRTSRQKLSHASLHHRLPLSRGGTNDSRNVIWCSQNKHRAFHTLFDNWEVPRIVEELNRWIDPKFKVFYQKEN